MKRVAILQPHFFPWRGVFEQIRLCDLFIHLDDVPFPQGRSLLSRVQIKTAKGPQWITLPVCRVRQAVGAVRIDESQRWRARHLRALETHYAKAPFFDEMMQLVRPLYALETESLSSFNEQALERISEYLGLKTEFLRASDFGDTSSSTEHLAEMARQVGATRYLTGHGALNYLRPEAFEQRGIEVQIMDYRRTAYPQLFGEFDPHVSILDLIANTGPEAAKFLDSDCKTWREYERTREV